MHNLKYAERNALLGVINPASIAASTVLTAWVPAANFHRFAAEIQTGVLGAAATVDAKLQQATSAAGAGAKDITGKAIAQIVKASGDNVQAILECQADDLDANGGFGFIALSITIGTAASILSATLKGVNARFMPASAFNAATVVQTI